MGISEIGTGSSLAAISARYVAKFGLEIGAVDHFTIARQNPLAAT